MKKNFYVLILATLFIQALSSLQSSVNYIPFDTTTHNPKNQILQATNRTCSENSDCHNIGTCIIDKSSNSGVCKCIKGTGGDLCQIVDDCVADPYMCGENTNTLCMYDLVTRKAVCICKFEEFQRFDPTVKKCKECQCGPRGKDCQFVEGQKVCTCEPGYVQAPTMDYSDGRCRRECNQYQPCRNGGQCIHGMCYCKPGTEGFYCEDINYCKYRGGCGDGATCMFHPESGPICDCPNSMDKYDPDTKRCKDCFCGEHSMGCEFDFLNHYDKKCNCEEGYAELKGICSPCNCGIHTSSCKFERYPDRKTCICEEGYVQVDNVCTECNCGGNAEKCEYVDGKKSCKCLDGFKNNSGLCARCDCDIGSTDCTFNELGTQNCTCKEGFQHAEGTCVDIDECLSTSDCPPGTICENTPGNYTCACRDGFKLMDRDSDPRNTGCIDIDECKNGEGGRGGTVCSDYGSRCLNTPGSYLCLCREDYTAALDSEGLAKDPGVFNCKQLQTNPWKNGAIVSLCAIGIICFIGFITIWVKRNSIL